MVLSKLDRLKLRLEALEALSGLRLLYKVGVEPVGLIDNLNTVFYVPEDFKPDSLIVYVNGVKQEHDIDYIISDGSSFITLYILDYDDILRVNYNIAHDFRCSCSDEVIGNN